MKDFDLACQILFSVASNKNLCFHLSTDRAILLISDQNLQWQETKVVCPCALNFSTSSFERRPPGAALKALARPQRRLERLQFLSSSPQNQYRETERLHCTNKDSTPNLCNSQTFNVLIAMFSHRKRLLCEIGCAWCYRFVDSAVLVVHLEHLALFHKIFTDRLKTKIVFTLSNYKLDAKSTVCMLLPFFHPIIKVKST